MAVYDETPQYLVEQFMDEGTGAMSGRLTDKKTGKVVEIAPADFGSFWTWLTNGLEAARDARTPVQLDDVLAPYFKRRPRSS
jgi:hypothetical protein